MAIATKFYYYEIFFKAIDIVLLMNLALASVVENSGLNATLNLVKYIQDASRKHLHSHALVRRN